MAEDKKLTDKEIVKALVFLESKSKGHCQNCAYENSESCDICIFSKILLVVDEINRLQAEKEHYSRKEKVLAETIYNYKQALEEAKAENERLKNDLKEIGEDYERLDNTVTNGAEVCHNCHLKYAEKIKQAKAEAYKECIEKVKENFTEQFCGQKYDLIHSWFNNVLKELVGEDNAK